MIVLNRKQIVLLFMTPLLCVAMLLLMPFLTNELGKTKGYLLGFCIYWFIFCVPASIYVVGGLNKLKRIYNQKTDVSSFNQSIYYLLAFIPCIATLFVVFKNFAYTAGYRVLLLALLFGIINGIVEELFWRGAFNYIFKNNIILGYIFPTLFFSIWHIALYLAKGIYYQGGFLSLVGGSCFMGILWGFIAYKTKSIQVVTFAHIITNFFAFTGLIYENWFLV